MLTWLLLLGVLAAVLRVAEYVVRRVVEHPKGPVLGICALPGAIGGVLKIIS